MLFMSLIQWWYGAGWRRRVKIMTTRVEGTIDFFSIALLLKTLFQPFRQISAGSVDGSIDAKMRAFADRLISRIIGAVVRTVIIIAGLVAIALHILIGLVLLVGWAFVPLLPVIGLGLTVMGWLP